MAYETREIPQKKQVHEGLKRMAKKRGRPIWYVEQECGIPKNHFTHVCYHKADQISRVLNATILVLENEEEIQDDLIPITIKNDDPIRRVLDFLGCSIFIKP